MAYELVLNSGYECNDEDKDQRYAVSAYEGTILSAPAFEIRWRSEDLLAEQTTLPDPGGAISIPTAEPSSSHAEGDEHGSGSEAAPTSLAPLGHPTVDGESTAGPQPTIATERQSTLRPGVIIAIALGAFFSAMLVLVPVAWVYAKRWRRRRSLEQLAEENRQCPSHQVWTLSRPPAELESKPIEPRELPATEISRDIPLLNTRPAGVTRNGVELDRMLGNHVTTEMPAGTGDKPSAR
jgi:hypothetical protein